MSRLLARVASAKLIRVPVLTEIPSPSPVNAALSLARLVVEAGSPTFRWSNTAHRKLIFRGASYPFRAARKFLHLSRGQSTAAKASKGKDFSVRCVNKKPRATFAGMDTGESLSPHEKSRHSASYPVPATLIYIGGMKIYCESCCNPTGFPVVSSPSGFLHQPRGRYPLRN